jgi:hypothetical protein
MKPKDKADLNIFFRKSEPGDLKKNHKIPIFQHSKIHTGTRVSFKKTGKFLVKQGIRDFLKTNTSPNVFIFSFPTSYYGDLP